MIYQEKSESIGLITIETWGASVEGWVVPVSRFWDGKRRRRWHQQPFPGRPVSALLNAIQGSKQKAASATAAAAAAVLCVCVAGSMNFARLQKCKKAIKQRIPDARVATDYGGPKACEQTEERSFGSTDEHVICQVITG